MDSGLLTQEDVKETRAGSGSRAKQDYWGALVLLNADGQSFDTVMAAINSSKCASCDVTLIVERKKGEPSKVLNSRVSACRSESNTDCNCSTLVVMCNSFSAWQWQDAFEQSGGHVVSHHCRPEYAASTYAFPIPTQLQHDNPAVCCGYVHLLDAVKFIDLE